MRRFVIILTILLPLTAAAQPTMTVKTAMEEIEKTFGVYFVYDADLPVDKPTAFHLDSDSTLQKNLRNLFDGTGISWYVKTQYVVLNECCASLRQAPVWPEPEQYREPVTLMDTLKEAVKTARPMLQAVAGGYRFDPSLSQRVVTPLGTGDVLKYTQVLPGVSTGGEGLTTFLVRGGDMGSNSVTLDDVPVYGISHLMGLSFVLPGDVIGVSEFQVGGFHSDASNLTASHLRLQSYAGDFERSRARFTVNPFMSAASVSTPLKKGKSSFLGSVRFSPVGLAYKAFKNVVDRYQDSFDDLGVTAGDIYGKFTVRCDNRNEIAFSIFGSLDNYRFDMPGGSSWTEKMAWSNIIANFSWDTHPSAVFDCIHTSFSLNDHRWGQEQIFSQAGGYFSARRLIRSTVDELMLQSTGSRKWDRWALRAGIQLRGARFNPGAYHQYLHYTSPDGSIYNQEELDRDRLTWSMLSTLHGELEYAIPDRLLLRLSLRGNLYLAKRMGYDKEQYVDGTEHLNYDTVEECTYSQLHPEAGLLAQVHLNPRLGIEGTIDYRTQYYHSLEMMRAGWTFDPVIAAEELLPPERSLQGYLGLFGAVGSHHFRIGGFYKQMWDLIYRKKATAIYDINETHWRDGLAVGNGNAYGAEFHYMKEGRILSWQISYTWSWCNRQFPAIAQGATFPARYDRRHSLHTGVRWKGLTADFTLQSGHHETISPYQLFGQNPSGEIFYAESPFNWRVPAFIRFDLGYRFSFRSGKEHPVNHNLTVGVYNLFNRRNASQIDYDRTEMKWKQISYFPIMPSITYQLEL